MKILYLMHVDWNWIKQRPHFIAEELAKNGNKVDIIFKKQYVKNNLVDNGTFNGSIRPIPSLRGGDRFKIIQIFNRLIYLLFLRTIKTQKYDYVFVSHPLLFSDCIKSKIIYDCMDDYAAFSKSLESDYHRNTLLNFELKLSKKAELVVFSSDYLRCAVRNRYGNIFKNSVVVNNAINMPTNSIVFSEKKVTDTINLTYIGTISNWFDFEVLKKVKETYKSKKIIVNLYGPCETKKIEIEDFNFLGPINHDKIFNAMMDSDILIMPFVLTELIKSVNPVKLYEYIYSGKPIITLKYGETEKFSDYVYLYEPGNAESFIEQLNLIASNNYKGKVSIETAIEYVKHNTWECRISEIQKYMEE